MAVVAAWTVNLHAQPAVPSDQDAEPQAQEQPLPPERRSRAVLEEVVVTARRREESLQDTPIAVTALSGAQLREQGILTVSDLTKSVPSLQINQGGHSKQIYIRGIGERTGFVRVDPTVGVYLDDLFIPRSDSQLLDIVDVESIQILRGPQGTLFGKNTTGGAIVMTLVKPHEQFDGYLEGGLGSFNQRRGQFAMNVPITDNFYTRVAANFVKDDGFMKDVNGSMSSSNNRYSLLWQTRWDATSDLTVDTLAFYGRVRERFAGINCNIANENALFMEGLFVNWAGDTDPSNPSAYRDNCEANSRQQLGDLRTNMGDTSRHLDEDIRDIMVGTTVNWNYHPDHNIKWVLGYTDAVRGPILNSDNDGGTANWSEAYSTDDSERRALSMELQFTGAAFNSRLNYAAGLFGMRETNDEVFVLLTHLAGFDFTTFSQLASGQRPTRPPPGGTTPMVGILTGPIIDSQFDLENTTLGVFSQLSYDLTEQMQLTLGLRYTAETRESNLTVFTADQAAVSARIAEHPLFGPAVGPFNPFLGPWALDPVQIAQDLFPDTTGDGIPNFPMDFDNPRIDSRKETFRELTPMASLSYNLPHQLLPNIIDTAMVYATWSNGFKSGFFEPKGVDGLQRVKPEKLENREIGFKIDAFGNTLRWNVALYSMVFEDMQLIQVTRDSSNANAVVFENAGESKIEGGEMELQWMPLPGWMANLSYSHNRYRFTEFDDLDFLSLATEGLIVPVDRTDEPFPVSPEQTLAAGLQVAWDTDFGTFIPRIDASYKSDIYLGLDRGSFEAFREDINRGGQKAFTLVDVRFSWMNHAQNTTVAVFINNVTDERYLVGTASVGSSVATFNQAYGDPRRYGVEVRREF